jgi:hypothetical protein
VFGNDLVLKEAASKDADAYHDAGAICKECVDESCQNALVDISGRIVVSGAVFPQLDRTGTYGLNYDCKTTAGIDGITATKTVIVRDTSCPSCTVNGGSVHVEASFPYVDNGAQCEDSLDGVIEDIVVINNVDVEQVGEYLVTYRARDNAGNWNDGAIEGDAAGQPVRSCKGSQQYIRTVTVVDTLSPVIALHYHGSQLKELQPSGNGMMAEFPVNGHTVQIFVGAVLSSAGLVLLILRQQHHVRAQSAPLLEV